MIETNRLVLVPIEKNPTFDELLVHKSWLNDLDLMKWKNNRFFYTEEQLNKWYESEYKNKKSIHLRIFKRKVNNPEEDLTYSSKHRSFIFDLNENSSLPIENWIGMIALQNIDLVHSNAEIAFYIGNSVEHGRGYMTEAINGLVDYGFNYLNLHRIHGGTPNPAAIRTFEKCGFIKEGEQIQAFKHDNTFVNHCNYYILNKNQDS